MELTSIWETFSGVLPTLPPGVPELWATLLLFAVPVALYFAATAIPFVTVYGFVRAHFGRRSLFERAARQQARLGNILNWLFVASAVAAFFLRVRSWETLHPVYSFGLCAGAVLLAVGTLLWTLVVAVWKPLRKIPVLHGLLALLSGSCLASLPVIGLFLGRIMLQGTGLPEGTDLPTLLELLVPALASPFWFALALVHFLEVCAAGGVGLWWLAIRRNRDDYGRDYYLFAAKNCGEWGAFGGWLALLCLGGAVWSAWTAGLVPLGNGVVRFFLGAGVTALLLASVWWTVIAASAIPMRRKIGMFLSLLLLLAALACFGVVLFA